jgi:selenocysteine-specific elongation factor
MDEAAPPPLTLGTAGHIDHGKTALIAALTGVDTDRLPEERRRGISIELGYARLELPSGRAVSVVDVPGHERFVRTMVAGATGIDFFLLVVAADDGVMPQTREHAAVLRGLGIDRGVVAITKADLLDPAPAAEEAAALMPGGQPDVVATSARTGEGLDELRAALDRVAAGRDLEVLNVYATTLSWWLLRRLRKLGFHVFWPSWVMCSAPLPGLDRYAPTRPTRLL